MIEYGPRPPAAAHTAPSLVSKHVAPLPGVADTARVPVTECVDHARAVAHEVTAPMTEYVHPAPAVFLEAENRVPELGVTFTAPSPIVRVAPHSFLDEGKSPKRAKKSSRRKRPHHHDDDDLLLSEATALADRERTLMREEMRSRLAAQLCPLSHLMFLSERPRQCQLCDQSAEELAWCPTCEEGACCCCFLALTTGTSADV